MDNNLYFVRIGCTKKKKNSEGNFYIISVLSTNFWVLGMDPNEQFWWTMIFCNYF